MRKPQQCYIFHQGAYERTEHCPTRIWQQQWDPSNRCYTLYQL
ncbi:hypothetical protein [Candidatus Kurthia intestinigallinarum]|nr:hypothetical protein [Kurthia sp. 3B1D]